MFLLAPYNTYPCRGQYVCLTFWKLLRELADVPGLQLKVCGVLGTLGLRETSRRMDLMKEEAEGGRQETARHGAVHQIGGKLRKGLMSAVEAQGWTVQDGGLFCLVQNKHHQLSPASLLTVLERELDESKEGARYAHWRVGRLLRRSTGLRLDVRRGKKGSVSVDEVEPVCNLQCCASGWYEGGLTSRIQGQRT